MRELALEENIEYRNTYPRKSVGEEIMTFGRKPASEKTKTLEPRKETKKRVKSRKNEREAGKRNGKLQEVENE